MSLAKKYSKEMIRELDQIPVYLPGANVRVGDIISFGQGIFGRKPFGAFELVGSLGALDVPFNTRTDTDPDSYMFGSEGFVETKFTFDTGEIGDADGEGVLEVNFSKKGQTYFTAIECVATMMEDTTHLAKALVPFQDKIDWKNSYIVSSVTVAKKALVMQSSSNTAKLELGGKLKNFGLGGTSLPDLSATVNIRSVSGEKFFLPWSDNVPVFMGLKRLRKDIRRAARHEVTAMVNNDTDVYECQTLFPEDFCEEV